MAGNINVILGNLNKMSLSKLLVLGGFIALIFESARLIGLLAIIVGFILYFRKF